MLKFWRTERTVGDYFFDRRDANRRGSRPSPLNCPDCGERLTPAHTRDTGDVTVLPEGACPVLFERRNPERNSTKM